MVTDHLKLLKDQRQLAQMKLANLPTDHDLRSRYAQRIAELDDQIAALAKGS